VCHLFSKAKCREFFLNGLEHLNEFVRQEWIEQRESKKLSCMKKSRSRSFGNFWIAYHKRQDISDEIEQGLTASCVLPAYLDFNLIELVWHSS